MNYIIKYNFIDNDLVEVIYLDNKKEVISLNKFNQFTKEGLVKMAFVLP